MYMFEQNIKTIINPFTVKIYDMDGNEVEETHWKYYVRTGNIITKDDARKYITITPECLLEKIWVKWCQNFCV